MKGLSNRRAFREIGAIETKTWWEMYGTRVRNWTLGALFITLLLVLALGVPE